MFSVTVTIALRSLLLCSGSSLPNKPSCLRAIRWFHLFNRLTTALMPFAKLQLASLFNNKYEQVIEAYC